MRFQEPGVNLHDAAHATPGYTLFAPVRGNQAYLIDMAGDPVHRWQLERGGTNRCRLTDDGHLFICEDSGDGPPISPGKGGMMREYDHDGNVVWQHHDPGQHHDARRLPNGNTVYIAWEVLDQATADRVKGGIPGTELDGKIYGDVIREIDPAGRIVWEWRVAEMDMGKYPICPLCDRYEYAHANTCSPLANGDVMVSFRVLNLLIIIDRQTGKIKWEHHDLKLGHQHDCHFIDNGNILVFANGFHGGADQMFSRLYEINPQTQQIEWSFEGTPPSSFFSANISGAQRLWSGNTLICEGAKGCLFEVTPDGNIVWEYVSPFTGIHPQYGTTNWIFRAYRYAPDAPQLAGFDSL